MRPNFQRYPYHDPARGVYGDCLRTCIASLLDLATDDVPHVLHDDSDEWMVRLNRWLAPFKRAYLVFGVDDQAQWRQMMALQGQDLYHLITVRTASGTCHQIIGRNGRPCWCPIQGDVEGRSYNVLEFGFLIFTSL